MMDNQQSGIRRGLNKAKIIGLVERAVFSIRWMLLPLYVGLVTALALYVVHFVHEVIDMARHIGANTEKQDILMLFILEVVDMTMISQLVVMTIQGGYAIFIRPLTSNLGEMPQWLRHGLGTMEQKVKLGSSIMGIMMVQLLKNFIGISETGALTGDQLVQREHMLGWVMVATLMFCVFNILMHPEMLRKEKAHEVTEGEHDHH